MKTIKTLLLTTVFSINAFSSYSHNQQQNVLYPQMSIPQFDMNYQNHPQSIVPQQYSVMSYPFYGQEQFQQPNFYPTEPTCQTVLPTLYPQTDLYISPINSFSQIQTSDNSIQENINTVAASGENVVSSLKSLFENLEQRIHELEIETYGNIDTDSVKYIFQELNKSIATNLELFISKDDINTEIENLKGEIDKNYVSQITYDSGKSEFINQVSLCDENVSELGNKLDKLSEDFSAYKTETSEKIDDLLKIKEQIQTLRESILDDVAERITGATEHFIDKGEFNLRTYSHDQDIKNLRSDLSTLKNTIMKEVNNEIDKRLNEFQNNVFDVVTEHEVKEVKEENPKQVPQKFQKKDKVYIELRKEMSETKKIANAANDLKKKQEKLETENAQLKQQLSVEKQHSEDQKQLIEQMQEQMKAMQDQMKEMQVQQAKLIDAFKLQKKYNQELKLMTEGKSLKPDTK